MSPVNGDDETPYGNGNTPSGFNAANGNTAAGAFGPGGGAPVPRSPGAGGGAGPSLFLVREQARDGNCLFRSFSDQMYGTPDHHMLVRDRCCQYIASERNYFEQFVANSFDEFLTRIQQQGEWGDDIEIEALSEIYDCRIEIYALHSHGSHALVRTFHEACDAKRPNPIRLQYEGQAHYNSLAPRSGFTPLAKSIPGQTCVPGEIEDSAISRSRRQREAGQRRKGAAEADAEQTEHQVLDESIRLSRLDFEHKSEAEMDKAIEDSKLEWERAEQERMDKEEIDAILQQSLLEEEQTELARAIEESKKLFMPDYGPLYPLITAPQGPSQPSDAHGNPSSSSTGEEIRDSRDYQYPESVYEAMTCGFPLEQCIRAYHLVGDSKEGILKLCYQNLGR